jgi:RNA polymerase sigma-70 factor (ECF subfamily)
MTAPAISIRLIAAQPVRRLIVEEANHPQAAADAAARRLAAAIARGDEAAFREFYDRYHRRLFRFAFVLSRGDESLAQETVQAAFVTAAGKLRSADGEAHLWNWLARVARQHLGRAWRRRDSTVIVMAELPDCPDATKADSLLEETLDAALLALDPAERELVESFYFDRLSQKELAERLGATPKSVSGRLDRARVKLRAFIARRLSHET